MAGLENGLGAGPENWRVIGNGLSWLAQAYAAYDGGTPNKADYFRNLILASHKVVSGPLADKVNELAQASPGRKRIRQVYVLQDSKENAMCLPTGDVFITTGILHKFKTVDELEFILGHEESHIARASKQLDESPSLPSYLQKARLEEYVSDVQGMLKANKKGNPIAGVDALSKIDTGRYGGATHGDTLNRILNLHWLTRLIDMAGIEREQRPLVLPFDGNSVTVVPDVKAFNDHIPGFGAAYLYELAKCKDIFQAIALYQSVGSVDGQLFGKIVEFAEDNPGTAPIAEETAEVIKTFCCGDPRPMIKPTMRLAEAMRPANLATLGVIPTHDDPEFVRTYIDLFRGELTRSDDQVAFVKMLDEGAKRLSSRRMDLVVETSDQVVNERWSELYNQFDKIFE